MTNAEMAKKIKELEDKLDGYHRDAEMAKQIKELDDRMLQLELAQKQLRINVISTYGIPEKAKTIETMYPCLWNCEHKGKECNGQAQECPIADHFSKQLQDACNYCSNDVAITLEYLKKFTDVKKDIIFSEFNAGKRAIVFNGSDHLEKDYLDFCRGFDKWCNKRITEDNMTPWSHWIAREKLMAPLMECSSIYEDHSSFAIWVERNDEKGDQTFKYHTLQKDWRERNTVSGLPYTEWSV